MAVLSQKSYDSNFRKLTAGMHMAMGYKKQDIEFVPSLQLFSQARANSPLTVLAGANNSGKSLTLRWLKSTLGRSAYFVGTNRFYHVYHFSSGIREANELDQFENSFSSHF